MLVQALIMGDSKKDERCETIVFIILRRSFGDDV
jgi:hypothetical protein